VATDHYRALPHGRQLEELWLDGRKNKLYPAERKLLDCAARGEICELGNERPLSATADNRVRGAFLRFLALGGDASNPLHEAGLRLTGAYVECADDVLDFQGAILPENLALEKCVIAGTIELRDALADTLVFNGLLVAGIDADRLETSGSVFLRDGFEASGLVHFRGAKIGGSLDCRDGRFLDDDVALGCDSIEVTGNVFLNDGFSATGSAVFFGARIGGDLICRNGHFHNADTSLATNRMTVDGGVFLDAGFAAEGKVSLEQCKVGTGLTCRGGLFNAADQSLSLKFSTINGNADFGVHKNKESEEQRTPCRFLGGVSLQSTKIEGDLIFTETQFNGTGNINLRNARIAGQLFWRQISKTDPVKTEPEAAGPDQDMEAEKKVSSVAELNLAGATCLTLNMDWDSWTMPDRVRLDRFIYQGFSELPADWNAKRWKAWLERQPGHHLTSRFRPHPYQQLATVLESSGYEEEARVIRIERREKQRLFATYHEPRPDDLFGRTMRSLGNFWRWVQKVVIGHGYRPGLAVIWLLGLVLVGWGVYGYAALAGIMTPTHPLIFKEAVWQGDVDKVPPGKVPLGCRENWVYPPNSIEGVCAASIASEYSSFNALVYSLDTAIPVVNFRMEDDWAPRVVDWQTGRHDWAGWLVRCWEWIQIGLGWVFSLLFVSAIGGVVRRD